MDIVILGCGRVGAKLASLMDNEGHKVSIIDKNRDAFKRLDPGFNGTKVGGLGIDRDILKKAGIEPTMRPQDLSIEDWIRLYKVIDRS